MRQIFERSSFTILFLDPPSPILFLDSPPILTHFYFLDFPKKKKKTTPFFFSSGRLRAPPILTQFYPRPHTKFYPRFDTADRKSKLARYAGADRRSACVSLRSTPKAESRKPKAEFLCLACRLCFCVFHSCRSERSE